jgi:lysophospholipase
MAHVEDFEFYVDDLDKFMKHVVVPEAGNKIFLIGHSMGGAIAVRYAERQPQEVAALALVSPMLDPYLPVDRFDATRIVCLFTAVSSLFWPNEYISGARSYDRTPISFENNDLTHSKPRFEKMHQILNEEGNDIAKLGGPSRKWVREACKGSARAIDAATEIKVPVLLLQAGDDTAVHNEAQEKFCGFLNTGASGEQCKGFTVLGARHAIFIEADAYRTPAMVKIFDFFSSLQR